MLNASPSGFCVEKPQPNYKRDGIFIVSLILIVLVLELASGTDNTVTMQTIPKEKSQPATAALAPAPPAPVAPVAPGELIQFDTPTGWAKSANASPMTTFALDLPGGATVSAIPLPAAIAGTTEIVNLWRQQVGLGAIGADEAAKTAQPLIIGGYDGALYDFAGEKPIEGQTKPPRIVTATVTLGQVAWFFKLAGSADVIEAQLVTFKQFLSGLKFQPGASAIDFENLMREAQRSAQATPPPPPPVQGKPTWTVPARWEEKAPTSMRLGNFTAGNGKAEITVMTFPGEVGGLLANVNRWRGQSGLPAVDAAGLAGVTQQIIVSGTPATLVEAVGEKTASYSVFHPVGDATWFYKISGPSAAVTPENAAFRAFLESIQFPK